MTVKELLELAKMRRDYIDIDDLREGISYFDVGEYYARLYYGDRIVESFDYDATNQYTLSIDIGG